MCGIVYAHSFDGTPVNNEVLEQYDKQKLRGQQGFGIFDGQFGNMVHESKEDAILKWLVKYDSNLLLMHHRFPTSTINVKRAAHPFSTKKYFGKTQYVLVHNGSISNAEELFCDHQELGIDYYSLLEDLTFNDSEALLWDFALYMEGKQKELKAKGGIAFICLKLVKGKLEKMYFARNTNPLNMLRTPTGISLSSEGEGLPIAAHTLHSWNYKLKRLTKRTLVIPGYYTGNYDNYSYTGSRSYTPGYTGYGDSWRDSLNDDYDWEDREGRKVKNILERQFGHMFKDVVPRRKVIEYEQDPNTQMMLPVGTIKAHEQQRKIAEEDMIAKKNAITEEEVTTEYMAFLAGVQGHFEQAYWAMECDYEMACDLPVTVDNIRARLVLEKVMERLNLDPEYIDEESVSDLWRTLWKTKTAF